MSFWEHTWQERADAIKLAYGETLPADMVKSFSWSDNPFRCPGACALCFPPIAECRDPVRHRRDDWLYLTMGLSQPHDKKQVERERAASKSYSAFGMEFAFIVPQQADWPAEALYYFMTYMTDGEYIKWGESQTFRKNPSLRRAQWWSVQAEAANGIFVKEAHDTSAVFYNPHRYPVDCRLYYANLPTATILYLNSAIPTPAERRRACRMCGENQA